MLDIALFAVAALLLLHALRLVVLGERDEDGSRKRNLGCGFGLIAGVFWGAALGRLLGDTGDGLRLALGVILLIPVVAAVFKPHGAPIVRAALSLVAAILIAGPVVQRHWSDFVPDESRDKLSAFEDRRDEIESALSALPDLRERLRGDAAELRASLDARGHATFDAAAEDPAAFAELRELADVERLLARADENEVALRSELEQLDDALRQLRRQVESEEVLGNSLTSDEVERMLEEIRADNTPGTPTTVDEFLEREELRELFERE